MTPELPYRLSVCGKHELHEFAGDFLTHLLSLEDPETPKETPRWFKGPHRQLLFHDVESPQEAVMTGATAPTRENVAEILRFGRQCLEASRKRQVHLLVHCFAGISRSTAASFALAAQALGPGRAGEALEYVRLARPEAMPNALIVQHADHLLARGGEMVRALGPLRENFRWLFQDCLEERWRRDDPD